MPDNMNIFLVLVIGVGLLVGLIFLFILFNFIGIYFTSYLVNLDYGPLGLKDAAYPQSDTIPLKAELPIMWSGTQVHAGLAIAVFRAGVRCFRRDPARRGAFPAEAAGEAGWRAFHRSARQGLDGALVEAANHARGLQPTRRRVLGCAATLGAGRYLGRSELFR